MEGGGAGREQHKDIDRDRLGGCAVWLNSGAGAAGGNL